MDNFAIWVCEHLNTDLPDHSFKLESGRLPARVPRDAKVVQLCEECRETYRQAGSQDGPLTEYLPVPKARHGYRLKGPNTKPAIRHAGGKKLKKTGPKKRGYK